MNHTSMLAVATMLALCASQAIFPTPIYKTCYKHETLDKTIVLITDMPLITAETPAKTVKLLKLMRRINKRGKILNMKINFYCEIPPYFKHLPTKHSLSLTKAIELATHKNELDTTNIVVRLGAEPNDSLSIVGVSNIPAKWGPFLMHASNSIMHMPRDKNGNPQAISMANLSRELRVIYPYEHYSYEHFLLDVESAVQRLSNMSLDPIAQKKLDVMSSWLSNKQAKHAKNEIPLKTPLYTDEAEALLTMLKEMLMYYMLPVIQIDAYHAMVTDENKIIYGYFAPLTTEAVGAMLEESGYHKVKHVAF